MKASIAIVSLLVLALPAGAEPLGVGERLPVLELEDPHGEPGRVDEDVRVVLFAEDMDGGEFIKQALADGGAAFLEEHGAVYVADVSGMPGIIRRLFALPRLRERPYPMLLDLEGEATAVLPRAEGKASVIHLDDLTIRAVDQVDSVAALREAVAGVEKSEDAEAPEAPEVEAD